MSNIDRYRLTAGDGGMYRDEDVEGDWVMYDDYTSSVVKLLSEQDYKYNKQTNELIARHADQLEVAAEFCRQYQIENTNLKAKNEFTEDAARDYERENIFLKSENQTLNVC